MRSLGQRLGSVGPKDDHGWVKLPREKQLVGGGEEEDEKMGMGPEGKVEEVRGGGGVGGNSCRVYGNLGPTCCDIRSLTTWRLLQAHAKWLLLAQLP